MPAETTARKIARCTLADECVLDVSEMSETACNKSRREKLIWQPGKSLCDYIFFFNSFLRVSSFPETKQHHPSSSLVHSMSITPPAA
jgi:hypothetical protein